MSKVRGKNTKPEIILRKALHRAGCRFRLHGPGVPGRPDITHKGARVAVFVDGCFWHGCPKHYRRPKSHERFWDTKLQYNVALRRRVNAALAERHWRVLEFWECQVRERAPALAVRVSRIIRSRKDGPGRAPSRALGWSK